MESNIEVIKRAIAELEAQLEQKRAELKALESAEHRDLGSGVSHTSSVEDKVRLFMSLFIGRDDIYARRFQSMKSGKSGYQPACGNEWVLGVCQKPKIKCSQCHNRNFLSLDSHVITSHLSGVDNHNQSGPEFVAGIYPMFPDETCRFLAMDFDKDSWEEDSLTVLAVCDGLEIPAYRERSRSGNGAHIWIFFDEAIPARTARMLGTILISKSLDMRPEIGMESFDRFFPNQDTMPTGGFGNLIALPLQKVPRIDGNSVFIDADGIPYPDQWAFLFQCKKTAKAQILQTVQENEDSLGTFRARTDFNNAIEVAEEKPWEYRTRRTLPVISQELPSSITVTIRDQIYIPKNALPAILRSRILWLASFSNPEFYKAQAMRLPTWNKPRILYCYDVYAEHIGLPVGLLPELLELLGHYEIGLEIDEQRVTGALIDIKFEGELYPEQKKAVVALLPHENGILSATTAFGKTIVAANVISERKISTLVLVHRKQLMEQWKVKLEAFTTLSGKQIGQFGGGRKKRTGVVDIAVLQSVYRNGEVPEWIAEYGQIIVDECHHISAYSFEQVIRRSPAKYKLGLSATIIRKDGQHPIVLMNIGKVRYSVNARQQARKRSFSHHVVIRETMFRLADDKLSIQEVFKAVVKNARRNHQIVDDIRALYQDGRNILIITERKEHIEILNSLLNNEYKNLFVLQGGLGKKQLKTIMAGLAEIDDNEPRIILATGRYLGEGFDLPILDTLLLVFPVSWKGTIAQYAGRLHREFDGKESVKIYDYVDSDVPVLSRMYERRKKGYKALGYDI
jgi:superfamily II DNA or RNA helicase